MARAVLVAAAGALASAFVLRRFLRSRRWFDRSPAAAQCACCTASTTRGLTTPSKRPRPVDPSDDDATPARPDRLNSDPNAATKRTSHLTWDEYFMAVAFLSAQRSKDPNRQVGACVVNSDRKIVGIGYNGFPWGCSDDQLPWAKKGASALDTKYPYVCHAELNAIMNANSKTLRVRPPASRRAPDARRASPAHSPHAPWTRARLSLRVRRAARST